MRPDVHVMALRSAAKLVLGMASIASITGCSSSAPEGTSSAEDAVTTPGGAAKSDTADRGVANDDPFAIEVTKDEPTSKACQATLAAAFPNPGGYQWEPVPQPTAVVTCCDEELTKHDASTEYRWECCVAYDESATGEKDEDGHVNPFSLPTGMHSHAMACTPWGPPVPPSMHRLRRVDPTAPRRRDLRRSLVSRIEPRHDRAEGAPVA